MDHQLMTSTCVSHITNWTTHLSVFSFRKFCWVLEENGWLRHARWPVNIEPKWHAKVSWRWNEPPSWGRNKKKRPEVRVLRPQIQGRMATNRPPPNSPSVSAATFLDWKRPSGRASKIHEGEMFSQPIRRCTRASVRTWSLHDQRLASCFMQFSAKSEIITSYLY